jgi:hypothetical protein
MDTLKQLREDLWVRWRQAFDRFAEVAEAPLMGGRVVYARVPLFDLKTYTPKRFRAGARVLSSLPENGTSYFAYALDSMGRPIQMAYRHEANNLDTRGLYRYTDDEVEYVEFCVQTQVVSEYGRMTLRDGLPAALQHIDINGGGCHLGGNKGKEAIDYILRNSYHYWTRVEDYEASEGRLVSGKAVMEGARLPPRRSMLEYTYSLRGKLERIVRVSEEGRRTTEYAGRSKTSMKELASKLAEKIATRAIEALRNAEFDSPLMAVELSYRSVSQYLPEIIPATEGDSIASLVLPTVIDPRRWISLNAEDFEPEMTEFVERLTAAEQYSLGTGMLRHAASIVTERAGGELTTCECFAVFAIDWEFEGQELSTVLKKCGASAATVKELESRGWLK